MSRKVMVLTVFAVMFFARIPAGMAQGESVGFWMNLLQYERSNAGSNFKIFDGGVITPYRWIGFGISFLDMYGTPDSYVLYKGESEWKAKYGLMSLVTPTIHFIPLAKRGRHLAFEGNSMNFLHVYMSYSPWSALSLVKKQSDEIPITVFGNSSVFDIGVGYTFNFIKMSPVSLHAGYLAMANPDTDINAYFFPSNRFGNFYIGLNISLGAWDTGKLRMQDKYTVAPFLARHLKTGQDKESVNREWSLTQTENTVEAYERFIRENPTDVRAREALDRLNDLPGH